MAPLSCPGAWVSPAQVSLTDGDADAGGSSLFTWRSHTRKGVTGSQWGPEARCCCPCPSGPRCPAPIRPPRCSGRRGAFTPLRVCMCPVLPRMEPLSGQDRVSWVQRVPVVSTLSLQLRAPLTSDFLVLLSGVPAPRSLLGRASPRPAAALPPAPAPHPPARAAVCGASPGGAAFPGRGCQPGPRQLLGRRAGTPGSGPPWFRSFTRSGSCFIRCLLSCC